MMDILGDADLPLLGSAVMQIDYKEEGEADYRGWNTCLTAIWKLYNEMHELRDKDDND